MIVDKITVGKSIERFGLWDRLDIQVTVQPGESPEEVHQEATQLLDKLLKITESDSPVTHVMDRSWIREEDTIDKRVQAIIEDINQCTAIDEKNHLQIQIGLIAYEDAANQNPIIKASYDLKMKQLKG